MGKNDEAIANFTGAIRLDPGMAAAYQARGAVYFLKGQIKEGNADLTKRTELTPFFGPSTLGTAKQGKPVSDSGEPPARK